jgi:hypothetical protein
MPSAVTGAPETGVSLARKETTVSSTAPPPPSVDQAAAHSELRALGRRLDRLVAEHEVEATLALMKQVHTGIVRSLRASAPGAAHRAA